MAARIAAAAARAAAAAGDAFDVQVVDEHLGLAVVGETHVEHGVQAVRTDVAIEGHARHLGAQAGDHVVLEAADVPLVLLQVRVGQVERSGQAHDAGHVLRTAPHVPLLRAALDHGLQAGALAQVQEAHALGPVELVGAGAQHVQRQGGQVEGVVPHGLHRVAVEERLVAAAEGADGLQVVAGAHLVVGVHQAHQGLGVGGQQLLQVGQVGAAVGVQPHPVHLHGTAAAQFVGGVLDGVVLDGRGDQVAHPAVAHAAGQGHVVRLGAAAGEDDVARHAVQALGHGAARPFHGGAAAAPEGVDAAGVAELLPQAGRHGLQHFGGQRRGGGVVQVDAVHAHVPMCPCGHVRRCACAHGPGEPRIYRLPDTRTPPTLGRPPRRCPHGHPFRSCTAGRILASWGGPAASDARRCA